MPYEKWVIGKVNQKHKKRIVMNIEEVTLDTTLNEMKKTIQSMLPKQQHLLSEWLTVWCSYLKYEKTFEPHRLVYYKRGDVVLANFGFNIGSELGGTHYAIVVENNNNKTNNVVTVVPVSSLDSEKDPSTLHKSTVFLGEIIPDSGKLSYAMPLQIRAISKLRIIKPKHSSDGKIKVNSEQLTAIDSQIKQNFTNNS